MDLQCSAWDLGLATALSSALLVMASFSSTPHDGKRDVNKYHVPVFLEASMAEKVLLSQQPRPTALCGTCFLMELRSFPSTGDFHGGNLILRLVRPELVRWVWNQQAFMLRIRAVEIPPGKG